MGAQGVQEIRIRHTISAPDKFIEEVGPAMIAYANSSAQGINDAIALMWSGLKDGHRVEKTPFNLTMDDVSDLLDVDQSALTKVMDVFARSFKSETPAETGK
jgi:hypothetical protein